MRLHELEAAEQMSIAGTMISNAIGHLFRTSDFKTAETAELQALHDWIGLELQRRVVTTIFDDEPF
jgi:hypothetical protein